MHQLYGCSYVAYLTYMTELYSFFGSALARTAKPAADQTVVLGGSIGAVLLLALVGGALMFAFIVRRRKKQSPEARGK